MRDEILKELKNIKELIKSDGLDLMAVFGSFARGEERDSSDIDILYRIENIQIYLKKYSGWNCINHIVEIRELIENRLNRKVDFVDIDSLNEIGKKYILKELVYV